MPTLSVTIITKNEAHDIRACLESIKWADEIIVLDSGSTDDTIAICREYTNHVFSTDWPGFGKQKNRALQKASGDWILSLDADERIPETLHQQILTAIQSSTDYVAYTMPRQSLYCGKLIKYGAWHSKSVVRLVKKNYGQFTDVLVHEALQINGKIGHLSAAIIHPTYQNLEEMLEKMNQYSTASAQQKFFEGKQGSLSKAIAHGAWAFLYNYILRGGFLDGKAGLMLAISNAEYSYYRYVKLMLLTNKLL